MLASRSTVFSTRRLLYSFTLLLVFSFGAGCASYGPKQSSSLSLSATKFNFQAVVVGATATQPLQISNTGTTPLQIAALSISNKQFSISGPSVPRTILPANSLTYTVAFTPTSSGSASATAKIQIDGTSEPASISLAGSGEAAFANLVVTPDSINFGNLTLAKQSTQNVTLQNTGDINLILQGVTVMGSGFGYSDLSPGFSLSPNQKITFQVWFSPKVAGPASAKVSLLSPNLSAPATLNLSGDGVTSSSNPTSTPTPALTQHNVLLTWVASASQVIGYRVYRSETPGGDYAPLVGAAINALTYNDTTVALGTTYYYVVTAVDASGIESVYSNQAVAVIPSF
jgi:hypothetical protein